MLIPGDRYEIEQIALLENRNHLKWSRSILKITFSYATGIVMTSYGKINKNCMRWLWFFS